MTEFFDIENLFPWAYLDPVSSLDVANAVETEITTSDIIITPAENVRATTVLSDKPLRVDTKGVGAVDDDTCLYVFSGYQTLIVVTPDVDVYALLLNGTAVVTDTLMIRKRFVGRALGCWMLALCSFAAHGEVLTP